ncbi:MAG: prepilin peptidase [Patescibacteria group bacterium]
MFSVLIFIFGLMIGSFLNVVICRLETKEKILISRSHCPQCGAILKWFELIPILSFLIQKARCRSCGQKISWQYPVVELSTGLLFLLAFNFFLQPIILIYYLIIICLLIIIFVYDLKHYLIPDKIIYPAIVIAGIFNLQPSIFNEFSIFKLSILSALGASGFFLLLVLATKGKGMGLGDVKLAFLMGLILGWPGILLALFGAFLSGAIIGLALIFSGKKKLKSEIPFGPFLVVATVLAIFCGSALINWYQNIFWF